MSKRAIWNYFKGKGFTECGIAGLMGNIQAESNFKSTNLQQTYERSLKMSDAEYTKAVDDGTYTNFVKDSAGYGLAQWTYWTRKQNLLNYAKKVGKSIGDLQMQLDFLYNELKGYKEVFEVLKTAKTVREASDIVLHKYERPGDQSEAVEKKRASYGEAIYKEFAGATESKPIKKPILNYFPKYTGKTVSIVDALNSIGATSSYAYRKTIASANGIAGYKGTAAQNTKMLNLLKTGKLLKP